MRITAIRVLRQKDCTSIIRNASRRGRKQALNLGINDGDNEGNAKIMLLPLIEVKFRAERSIQFSPGYFLYMNNHYYGLKLRNEFRREKD